jgi:magnesium-transporting ATPase (P-type)
METCETLCADRRIATGTSCSFGADRRGADRLVITGESVVNESMLTGESRPVDEKVGAKESASPSPASCGSSKQAQTSRPRAQALTDRAAE